MEDEQLLNEYQTLTPEPIFQPDPISSASPSLETQAVTNQLQAKASLASMPSAFDFGRPDAMGSFGADNKISLEGPGIGMEAYRQLSDGTLVSNFEAYNPAVSAQVQEEMLAERQSGGALAGLGVLNFVNQTAISVVGGTVGVVNGLAQAMNQGSLEAFYNNDFSNYLEDLRKKNMSANRIYTPAGYEDLNFFQKMGYGKFYADELAGGLSFLAGTILSEGMWAAATGGTSLFAKGALGALGRKALVAKNPKALGNLMSETLRDGKNLLRNTVRGGKDIDKLRRNVVAANNFQKVLNTSRFMVTSAGFESSVEALGYAEEAEATYIQQMLQEEGRNPTAEELGNFRAEALKNANYVFGANMGLVGFSNMVVLGKLVTGRNVMKPVSNSFFKKHVLGVGYKKGQKGMIEAVKPNMFQKIFSKAYGIAKPMFTEGFIEEGGQSVASKAAIDYSMSAFDPDSTHQNLRLVDSLMEGFAETYGTKEGMTEVGLGALIGIFGGGFSSGFRFNEYSRQRQRLAQDAKFVNNYTNNKIIGQMMFANKIARAVQGAENARAEGNLTDEMQFSTAAITASVEAKLMFDNINDIIKDFEASIDTMDDAQLQQQMGMTAKELDNWKSQKKAEYREVAREHAKNINFANALIGEVALAGVEGLEAFTQAEGMLDGGKINKPVALRSAIAFAMTTGRTADQFSQSLAEQMKQMVANQLSTEATDAISVNELLRKIDAKTEKELDQTVREKQEVRNQIDNLQNEIIQAQKAEAIATTQEGTTKRNKSQELSLRLQELTTKLTEIEADQAAILASVSLETATPDQVITPEMLDSQANNIQKLRDTVTKMSARDPEFAATMNALMSEYGRATERAKAFDATIRAVLNPKTRVTVLNGWLSNMIKKNKGLNEPTGDYFNQVVTTYYGETLSEASGAKRGAKATTQTDQEEEDAKKPPENPNAPIDNNENPLDNPPENVSDEIEQELRDTPPTPKKKVNIVEQLKAVAKSIIESDTWAKANFQGVEQSLEAVVPTQQELDRYNELLGKADALPREPRDFVQDEAAARDAMGLDGEEFAEFLALNRKLNNWTLLKAETGMESSTIADILFLARQHELGFTPDQVKLETTMAEFIKLTNAKTVEDTASPNVHNTVVAPDIVTAKKTDGTYQLSHMKPTSLLRIMPEDSGAKLFVVMDGRPVDTETVPEDRLSELMTSEGTVFQLQTEPGQKRKDRVKFTIGPKQRLVVKQEAFEALVPQTSIEVMDFSSTNYMPVFEVNAAGELAPMDGDFIIRSVSENETVTLDKNAMYGMRRGEPLRAVVNLKDSYNVKLMRDLKDGKITEEEFANKLHIYLAQEGATNNVVGALSAIREGGNEKTALFVKMHFIRKLAAKKAKESSLDRIELGITIPLAAIKLGTPIANMVRNEDGTYSPQNMDLTDEALSQVQDYGYIQDGQYFLRNNLEVSEENGIFAAKVSEKNPGAKVPIIVFEHRGRSVAFPVSLKTGKQGAAEAMAVMQNPETSDTEKIILLNEIARRANIDFTNYPVEEMTSEQAQELLGEMLGEIQRAPTYVNPEQWLEPGHQKQALAAEVQIAIDITNNPFSAPKGILNFSRMELPTEREMEIESVKAMDKYSKIVHNLFIETEPFQNMTEHTKFYDAFYANPFGPDFDNTQDPDTGFNFKKKNANILMDAFQYPLSKPVKEALGQDLIDEIKAEINMFKLLKKGLPTKMNLQKKLDSELAKLKDENECQ